MFTKERNTTNTRSPRHARAISWVHEAFDVSTFPVQLDTLKQTNDNRPTTQAALRVRKHLCYNTATLTLAWRKSCGVRNDTYDGVHENVLLRKL